MIRNSVLYAAEVMYSIKETDYRALESTEESVLLKVFATKKSCSRHLMYLEAGMVPARYQVQRQVLNFLHYILQQPDTSLIHRVFIAMQLNPTKGDWASFALDLLEKFEMNMSITDIKKMKSSQFKSLVKEKMQKIAFLELTQKQKNGQKGRKIIYRSLSMADYLLPEANLTVEEKRNVFSLRLEMNENPCNFGSKIQCEMGCPEIQENSHILECPKLNESGQELNIEDILNGSIPIPKAIQGD